MSEKLLIAEKRLIICFIVDSIYKVKMVLVLHDKIALLTRRDIVGGKQETL